MRRRIWGAIFLSGSLVTLTLTSANGATAKGKTPMSAEAVGQVIENKAKSVQLVTFPATGWNPVKVVRGGASTRGDNARPPSAEKTETAEIITFGDSGGRSVRILRGDTDPSTFREPRRSGEILKPQIVTFADPRARPVSVLRGWVSEPAETGLFGPASIADLDRVAFAVDGAESSHGADLRMWRPEPSGPQGPMQVTAAAAIDVGGGDRFDLAQNRVLGRAYLARMYRRYGNWPDAIAAYNWGPGNVDAWIGGGRPASKFPIEVERYRDRVLREAALGGLASPVSSSRWPFRAVAPRGRLGSEDY
jgi:Transglycosylase SLT domain